MGVENDCVGNIIMEDDFEFIDNGHGYVRLISKSTGKQFGEQFQSKCRSSEIKSALIVYEKYKRKYNLEHADLKSIGDYVIAFVETRKNNGKNTNFDFMTQEASAELKRRHTQKPKLEEDLI